MFGDEDDAADSALGATRYPVMPSLIAKQQMKNRLHMAKLGRKLMKWTSVAAAAELRRISAHIQSVYKTFTEEVKEAFAVLARCRYFFPDINKIVINNVSKMACMTVGSSYKTMSGVKIIQYNIMERCLSYDYLGLGQGGETIDEAKRVWVKLLKLQILMVELRRSFMIVEEVHKSATKKMNVLGKITIPRTLATIKFINTELDETDREEHYRLKKLQNKKEARRAKAKEKKSIPTVLEGEEPSPEKPKAESESPPLEEELLPPTEEEPSPLQDLEVLIELKEKVSHVINLTKEITDVTVREDVEGFVQQAEEVKEMLERLTPGSVRSVKSKISPVEIPEEPMPKEPIPEEPVVVPSVTPPQPAVETAISADRLILGTFITEEEVITRIVKIKQPDGSITKEKRVITRTRVVNTPAEPSQTNRYVIDPRSRKNNPNVMMALPNIFSSLSVKSDFIKRAEAMSDPRERCCVSCTDVLDNSLCDFSFQSLNTDEMCETLMNDDNMFSTEITLTDTSEIDFPDDTVSVISDFSGPERRLLARKYLSEPRINNNGADQKAKKSISFNEKQLRK